MLGSGQGETVVLTLLFLLHCASVQHIAIVLSEKANAID